jgi:chaperonin GroEL
MTTKQIKFDDDARNAVKVGIDLNCNAVKKTIGPKGRNAFLDDYMQPKMTNDGDSISRILDLEDKFANMGSWLAKNTSAQTNEEAGDGTSTTAVLLQAIIDEAFKRPENPMDIKRSLQEIGKKVEKWIAESAQEVKSNDQIENVAVISSESKEIGKLVAEVISHTGKDIPVTIEENNLPEVTYEVTNGLETKVGYMHPVWINNTERQTIEYDDIPVFACDRKINNLPELHTLLTQLNQQKITNVLFLVSDIDNSVLGNFVLSKQMGAFNGVIVRVRGTELEDMASVAGATLISETSGIKFADIKLEHLGMVKRAIINETKTILIGTDSEKQKEAVDALKAKAKGTTNIYERKSFLKRASAIQGGVVIIKVGGHTDSEKSYLKDKIEDAVNATRSALEEGLVEGGGMCLFRISNKIKGNSVGEEILRNALKAPLKAIVENAGKDYTHIVKKLTGKKGYNASLDKNVDMFKAGIVDPAKVTRCAFQNSLSSASNFITMGVAITDIVEKK